MRGPMRILHAPVNIADQAGTVVRALRRLGHDAEMWEYGAAKWGFPADRTIDVSSEDPRALWRTFLEAAERFDVFHFHFGRSFFPFAWSGAPPFWDLPVLRTLGKKVFFTFLGSDCRMRRVHERHTPWSGLFFGDFAPDDDRTAKSLQVIRTYAMRTFVVRAELSLYVPDADYMPFALDLGEWEEIPPADREVARVVHVPSRRAFKGTDLIVRGLERLEREGVPFEFRLLEGIPHDEMKKAIAQADVVVDSLPMGDYGVTSIETMAAGRVAVAYLMAEVRRLHPEIPIFDVTPDDFVERMRLLLTDREMRRSLAARGRPYVVEHFDATKVARKHLEYYEREWPPLPARAFPDWTGFGDARKVERLEERVAGLEQERAYLRGRERDLRAQVVELTREAASLRKQLADAWTPKKLIPAPARRALRRLLERE